MKFCNYCGKENDSKASNCIGCGCAFDFEIEDSNNEEPEISEEKEVLTDYYVGDYIPYIKTAKKKQSMSGVAGFILAFFPVTSIAGFIVSLIDLIKHNRHSRHGLAIAGLIISAIVTAVLICMLFFSSFFMSLVGEQVYSIINDYTGIKSVNKVVVFIKTGEMDADKKDTDEQTVTRVDKDHLEYELNDIKYKIPESWFETEKTEEGYIHYVNGWYTSFLQTSYEKEVGLTKTMTVDEVNEYLKGVVSSYIAMFTSDNEYQKAEFVSEEYSAKGPLNKGIATINFNFENKDEKYGAKTVIFIDDKNDSVYFFEYFEKGNREIVNKADIDSVLGSVETVSKKAK